MELVKVEVVMMDLALLRVMMVMMKRALQWGFVKMSVTRVEVIR